MSEIPKHGGMVDFNCVGVGGCIACGWRGIPTFTGGERRRKGRPMRGFSMSYTVRGAHRSTYCPACEGLPEGTSKPAKSRKPRGERPPAGKHAPCTCGSGRKWKRCCGRASG